MPKALLQKVWDPPGPRRRLLPDCQHAGASPDFPGHQSVPGGGAGHVSAAVSRAVSTRAVSTRVVSRLYPGSLPARRPLLEPSWREYIQGAGRRPLQSERARRRWRSYTGWGRGSWWGGRWRAWRPTGGRLCWWRTPPPSEAPLSGTSRRWMNCARR